MPPPARKATFALDEAVLGALSEAVAHGAAASKNALVERALRRELKEVRRQVRQTQWEKAAADPLFLKDIQEVEAAFASADGETARGIV